MQIAEKSQSSCKGVPEYAAQISVLGDDLVVSFQSSTSLRDFYHSNRIVSVNGPYGIQVFAGVFDAVKVS